MPLRAWARSFSKGWTPSPILLSLPPSHFCMAHPLLSICNSSPYVQVCRGVQRQGEHHPTEKPPWDVQKDTGWWPARCCFIVVAPSRCWTGQSLWMCWFPASVPVCPSGAGQESYGRSTQAIGQLLLFHSADCFFSGGKSLLGELESRQWRQRAARGQGGATKTSPCSGDSNADAHRSETALNQSCEEFC